MMRTFRVSLRLLLVSLGIAWAFLFWAHPLTAQSFDVLYSYPSVGPFNSPKGILANRNSQIAALAQQQFQPKVLVFHTEHGTFPQTVTAELEEVFDFRFSNWGTVLEIVHASGLPPTFEVAPLFDEFEPIFTSTQQGSLGRAGVNDLGLVAFTSRVTNQTGDREIHQWSPDEGLQPLPELGENQLGADILIDDQSRIVVAQEFLTPSYAVDVYRYNQDSGWENLTADFDETVINIAGGSGWAMNLQGDFTFPSKGDPDLDGEHWLNLYDQATGQITRVLEFSRFDNASSRIQTEVADTGEVLALVGENLNFDPFRAFYRFADGSLLDLSTLLPEGHSFSQVVPKLSMNYGGDLLLEALHEATGRVSFFYWPGNGSLHSVPNLQDLDFRPDFVSLTDDGKAYLWQDRGDTTVLGVALVPEPTSLVLLLLGSVALGLCHLAAFLGLIGGLKL